MSGGRKDRFDCTLVLRPGSHGCKIFGFLYAKRCSFHGYCSKILKLQREARRSKREAAQRAASRASRAAAAEKKAQAAALAM